VTSFSQWDRYPVTGVDDYHVALGQISAGNTVTMKLWRDRKEKTLALKARVFPEEQALALAEDLFGIVVTDMSDALRRRYRIAAEDGVVITDSRPHTEMDRIGIQPGDVIRRIDDRRIETLDDYKAAIVAVRRKKSVEMVVQRGRRGYVISVGIL
jgi:serine protease Do